MAGEKQLGAHGGGIPAGWDFPSARAAAEQGEDLWLLDSALNMTPWERMQNGMKPQSLGDAAGIGPNALWSLTEFFSV